MADSLPKVRDLDSTLVERGQRYVSKALTKMD